MGVEPKNRGTVPQNGWFIIWKTLLKWMIWVENPLFSETLIKLSSKISYPQESRPFPIE